MLPWDRSAAYHVVESTPKLERLAAYVQPGDLVFDVGAHAGLFAVMAARRGAKVVAVEPDPHVARFLRANVEGLDAHVVEAALTDEPTAILWRVASSTQTSSLIRDAAEDFGEVEPVDVDTVSFDDLVARFRMPDVLKLDVQGYESRLAPGLPLEAIRTVLVEVSTLDDPHFAETLGERLGPAEVVNEVHGGADLAFTRS